jgi:uncharacterized protein
MRFDLLVILVATLVSGLQAQQSPTNPSPPLPQVRTTATATRSIPPELAVATFEFSGRGPTLNDAAVAASAIGKAIRRALTKAGVSDDSILGRGSVTYAWDQATSIDIKQNSEFRRYDTTFVFNDRIVARIRDLRRVEPALDAALAAGAQKLTSLQFSSSRVQKLAQEALSEATREARRNAELMAEGAGGKLGRPLELTTEKASSENSFYDLRATNVSTGASTVTRGLTAAPPDGELRASVYGRWELISVTDSAPAR